MSWEERPYADDSHDPMRSGSRFSDNPMGWSFSIGRLFGIDIRIHFIFIVYVGMELLLTALGNAGATERPVYETVLFRARWMGLLFSSVFLHELGHCFAARSVGGSAHEVLMWPLGGLATVQAPMTPWAQFVTAAGGPLVNVGICAIAAGTLTAVTGDLSAVPWNPFSPWLALAHLTAPWQLWIYQIFNVNYWLLLFNLILLMYPFDGGRILQTILWPYIGFARSMYMSTTVGMVGAVILGLFGLMKADFLFVGIAVFGYITCMNMRRMLAGGEIYDERLYGGGYTQQTSRGRNRGIFSGWLAARRERARIRRIAEDRRREHDEDAEVDRILQKVHEHGMQTLTRAEKRTLELATQRQRKT